MKRIQWTAALAAALTVSFAGCAVRSAPLPAPTAEPASAPTAAAEPIAPAAPAAENNELESGLGALSRECAAAYLAVVDDVAAHIGTEESAGEYLRGGFIRDWDGDGTPELCLLLKTSPRAGGGWEGTPSYGWYAPTL